MASRAPASPGINESLVSMLGQETEMNKFVAYIRVSTQQQGRSGLGLEAQQSAVRAYLSGVGGELVEEFVEVEAGSSACIRAALDFTRQTHETLGRQSMTGSNGSTPAGRVSRKLPVAWRTFRHRLSDHVSTSTN